MADFHVYAAKREREDESLVRSLHEKPRDAQKIKAGEEEKGKRWTPEQDDALRKAVDEFGQRNWKAIASRVDGRNHAQCLQRWNKVLKPGLVKGHWSFEEDNTLEQMVLQGCHSWAEVAANIPGRTAKQCRERWRNHLDPSINKGPFTAEEDRTIQEATGTLGNRWTQIAELLPGRTEDAIKLRWKTLNPNQKIHAKPGRPKLMPGMPVSKPRSTAPPTPDDVAATLMAQPVQLPDIPVDERSYEEAVMYSRSPVSLDDTIAAPSSNAIPPLHPQQTASLGSIYPEPIVDPLGEDSKEEVDMNDVAMLKELLRSHSNSTSGLLSFGSVRGLSSFTDMSPDELLASGELDEIFKAAVSIDENRPSNLSSQRSSRRFTGSFSNLDSFSKAVQGLGSEDKHLFQGLIDSWRSQQASGQPTPVSAAQYSADQATESKIANLPVDPSVYQQDVLTSSLHFRPLPRGNSGKVSVMDLVNDDDDDDLDMASLMRPIHRGVQY